VRNFLAGHSETLLTLTDWNLPVSTGEKLIEELEKDCGRDWLSSWWLIAM